MSGVMPALETHNNIGPATEPVDDLAFAFVAPLGFNGSVLEVIPSDNSSLATTRLGVISFPHTKRELPI
jgi:hypothetical protein